MTKLRIQMHQQEFKHNYNEMQFILLLVLDYQNSKIKFSSPCDGAGTCCW